MLDPGTGLLLVNLLLGVQEHLAPRILIGQLLKSPDQPQHLKIFGAVRHGKISLKKVASPMGKLCNGSPGGGTWNFVEG